MLDEINTRQKKFAIVAVPLISLCFIMISLLSIADAVAHYRMEGKIDTINTRLAPTPTTAAELAQFAFTSIPTITPTMNPEMFTCAGNIYGSNVVGYDKPTSHSTALVIFEQDQSIGIDYLSADLNWVQIVYEVWSKHGTRSDYSVWVPVINVHTRNCPMMVYATPQATPQ